MKKIKEYWLIILLVLSIFVVLFYWYELRPNYIMKNCSQWKESSKWDSAATKLGDKYWISPSDLDIERCLKEHGLNK